MATADPISRRAALTLGCAAGLFASLPEAGASSGPTVVELFTSQGCSSCPPADRLLQELRQLPGVLALSYHVDYWDYLGWRDTLASPDFSQRQYDYAKARGDMDVYTPQIIVNGARHMVGSSRERVMAAIAAERQRPLPVPLAIADTAEEIVVTIGRGEASADTTLWVMPLLDETTVKIERGEIAGRNISYHNVVRRLLPAAMWRGAMQTVRLPRAGLLPPDCRACASLLQEGKAGRLLGAASWGEIAS
jgi:hypothetical protein